MQTQPRRHTRLRLGTLRAPDLGPDRAAHAEVAVPEANVAGLLACRIDLHQHRARQDVGHGEDKVGHLHHALVAGLGSDLQHRARLLGVGELGARGRQLRPRLADEPAARGDDDGVGQEIDALREEDELAGGGGVVENGLDGGRVVSSAVARDRVSGDRLDVDDRAETEVGVGRRGEGRVGACSWVDEGGGARDRDKLARSAGGGGRVGGVGVAADPGGAGLDGAGEGRGGAGLDSLRWELSNVFKLKRTGCLLLNLLQQRCYRQ